MKENWLALYLSILTDRTVDSSLGALGKRPKRPKRKNKLNLTQADVNIIKFLKKEHTWKEIGKMCDIDGEFIRSKVRNFKITKELCQAPTVITFKNISISL
ncbi:hypothetical protein [Clostridium botulinum]|uniref:hypothetical protein n=1 Tax=Clostridium botulinum TaxID=1491 RepID=UPI001966E5A8|nr:hypothetical protein [Clostridium botulinum]MBN1079238.1 hypothetical protein [Clostridium botulinum]